MNASATLAGLLEARHSCRAFLPDPVPRDTITAILGLAQRTPSWCNAQPWQVVVTSGTATDRFRDAMQAAAASQPAPDLPWPEGYPDIYGDRRRACGWQLYEAVGVARDDRAAAGRQAARNFALFDAPHVAIVSAPRALGTYGAVDCGGYVLAFLLACEAHGVAAIPQAALAAHAPVIHDQLAIPGDRAIVCGISFGFADRTHPANVFRTARAPLDEVVTFMGDVV